MRICRNKGGNYVQAYPTAYRRLRTIRGCDPKRNTVRQKHQRRGDRLSCDPAIHIFSVRTGILADAKEQYESESKGRAEQFLGVVKKAAEKAGVRCDTECVTSSHPYEMIIKAAEKKGCDLIMMASHGRRGLQGLLIGSETHKVLTHNRIPVLVLRQAIVTIFCKVRFCLRTSIASFFEGFFLCAIVDS